MSFGSGVVYAYPPVADGPGYAAGHGQRLGCLRHRSVGSDRLSEFHRKTAPRDLLQGLLKAYVGDGIAADFGNEIAAYVDPETRQFLDGVLSDPGRAAFVVPYVQAAIAAEPGSAGRLALWGRRLMGEALAQAQRVAADRPDLAELVVGGPQGTGAGLAEFAAMLQRMTESHSGRMRTLGLEP